MRTTRSRVAMVILVIAAAFASDLTAKYFARAYLRGAGTVRVAGHLLLMTYAENDGAFLGLGHAWPRPLKLVVFSGLSAIVVAAAGMWAALNARLEDLQVFALSVITGGGLGNLVDRLTHDGRVTDFLNVGVGTLRSGVFNLADVYLLAGMILLLMTSRGPRR
jgi:signal peptidase II